jgi:hypothetical protein
MLEGSFLLDTVSPALALYLMILAVAGLAAKTLAEECDKNRILVLFFIGFFVACTKIWLVQLAPQWNDTSPDSITYQLHAQAIALHWQGQIVDAASYQLSGFLNWYKHLGSNWGPEMGVSYAGVLGSHEWIYSAYLACWRTATENWLTWAMYSNAALAAIFPAASYGIARSLNASERVATWAAVIAFIDPLSAVNTSWLLKDTLAGFFAVCAAWAAVRLLRAPNIGTGVVMFIATALLGSVRFAGFVAILLSIAIVLPTLYSKQQRVKLVHLGLAGIASIFLFCAVYTFPKFTTIHSFFQATTLPLRGQQQIFSRPQSADQADHSVVEWKEKWKSDPIKAVAISAARTLFAPYPWVAVTDGLSFKNGIELYFLGMLVWIACLPGLAWGIIISLRIPSRQVIFINSMLFAILVAYTIFFGEWSTRQRVFMLPVFFSFAAIGWCDLYGRRKLSSRG